MSDELRAATRAQNVGGDSFPPEVHRPATIESVASDGSVGLRIGDSDEMSSGARALGSYAPTVGDSVWVLLRGADPLVMGWQADGVTQRTLPAGLVIAYAGGTAPPGWLFCRGQAVSRTVYARLFAAIGGTYGVGDGSTTFNLPNLQGRFPIGVGTLGSDTYPRANAGGVARHTLTEAEMPSHDHGSGGSTGDGPGGSQGVNVTPGSGDTAVRGGDHSHSVPTSDPAGGDDAHENRPPWLAFEYLVST